MSITGNKIKGVYDQEVIASIIASTKAEDTKDITDKYSLIEDYKPKINKSQVKFSKVFWKPTTIPDLPLPVFTKEDWHEEAQLNIPSIDPNWEWNKGATERLALALFCGDTTLLWGLQGTGKSCLAEQWCAKLNIPFWRMNCNRETREGHFLGSPGVEYNAEGKMYIKQEPTALTESLRYGGMFCEDEAFRHNAALVLQSLREKNSRFVLLPDAPGRTAADRKLMAPKDRWWYVMTDNTCGLGDETGTFDATVQDLSTLDRIGATIEMSYLNPTQETKILKNHVGLNDEILKGMVSFANLARKAFASQNLLCTMSIRPLIAWAEKTEIIGDVGTALQIVWYDKLSSDDKNTVRDIYHQVFGKKLG